jgi:hypothetical protein
VCICAQFISIGRRFAQIFIDFISVFNFFESVYICVDLSSINICSLPASRLSNFPAFQLPSLLASRLSSFLLRANEMMRKI